MTTRTKRPRAYCVFCHGWFTLKADGRIRMHEQRSSTIAFMGLRDAGGGEVFWLTCHGANTFPMQMAMPLD